MGGLLKQNLLRNSKLLKNKKWLKRQPNPNGHQEKLKKPSPRSLRLLRLSPLRNLRQKGSQKKLPPQPPKLVSPPNLPRKPLGVHGLPSPNPSPSKSLSPNLLRLKRSLQDEAVVPKQRLNLPQPQRRPLLRHKLSQSLNLLKRLNQQRLVVLLPKLPEVPLKSQLWAQNYDRNLLRSKSLLRHLNQQRPLVVRERLLLS